VPGAKPSVNEASFTGQTQEQFFRHYIDPYLKFINHVAVYLLIGGYGLLLAAVYIL
jgi:hypothetical protein